MVKKKVKKSSEKEDWHTEIRMKTTLKHGKKAKKHGKKIGKLDIVFQLVLLKKIGLLVIVLNQNIK